MRGDVDKGLYKLEMFGHQTSSNIVWWPNMLMLKWVAKRRLNTFYQTQIKQKFSSIQL